MGGPKADIVREVAWIYSYRSSQNADKGGEGVQNPENFADVLYVWSLMHLYAKMGRYDRMEQLSNVPAWQKISSAAHWN